MSQLTRVCQLLFIFVLIYFLYQGITTQVWEGDSLAYHLPIAQNILQLKFSDFSSPSFYFPASVETILTGFMFLHIPLNLFNVMAWVLVFLALKKTASIFGLRRELSLVFATTICLLPSVIRLLPTQTIDIWLAVFWLWSLITLEKFTGKNADYLKLGLSWGFLIGAKYSGPMFLLPLLLIYHKRLISHLNLNRLIIFGLPFLLIGASWYLRNWYFMGSPIYPAGAPSFTHLMSWRLWQTPIMLKNGTFLLVQALVSEYLIWCLMPIYTLFMRFSKLKFLGWANLLCCLYLPTWPENIISDLRYTYVVFIPLILLTFLYFQKRGWSEKVALIAIVSMISVLPQLNYFPKLFILLPGLLAGLWLR